MDVFQPGFEVSKDVWRLVGQDTDRPSVLVVLVMSGGRHAVHHPLGSESSSASCLDDMRSRYRRRAVSIGPDQAFITQKLHFIRHASRKVPNRLDRWFFKCWYRLVSRSIHIGINQGVEATNIFERPNFHYFVKKLSRVDERGNLGSCHKAELKVGLGEKTQILTNDDLVRFDCEFVRLIDDH